MELTSELKQKLVARVKHFVDVANTKYPHLNMSVPNIKFDLRGRTGGTAHSATHTVDFNAGLYVRNVDEYMNVVVPHEVAHLIQYKLHPSARRWTGRKWVRTIQPHGFEWQSVMRTLGIAHPERCHQMDTTEVRVKKNVTKYQYKCNCSSHTVGAKVHNKIQLGAKYTCRKCKGVLTAGTFNVVKPAAPVVAKPAEPATKLPKIGSKKERAEALYMSYYNMPNARELIIAAYMQELDMTKAGASTYYANAKKKFG